MYCYHKYEQNINRDTIFFSQYLHISGSALVRREKILYLFIHYFKHLHVLIESKNRTRKFRNLIHSAKNTKE